MPAKRPGFMMGFGSVWSGKLPPRAAAWFVCQGILRSSLRDLGAHLSSVPGSGGLV